MNKILISAVLLLAVGPVLAGKSCEAVKSDIARKIEGHHAKGYTLIVVGKDEKHEGKVIGHCDHGAKAIVYKRR